MSTLTITIEAPEMVAAIRELATALGNHRAQQTASTVNTVPQQTPVTPISNAVPQQTPVALTVNTVPQQTSAAVPTVTATYTIDQLAYAASPLLDAGKLPELQALLNQFGVNMLTELPAEQYGAFATALRGLGAKI
jgi:hypothetical protein